MLPLENPLALALAVWAHQFALYLSKIDDYVHKSREWTVLEQMITIVTSFLRPSSLQRAHFFISHNLFVKWF